MTFLSIADLAADMQAANEPEPVRMTQAEWEALERSKNTPWSADPKPECSTGHVMPRRALRYQVQRIGLLW